MSLEQEVKLLVMQEDKLDLARLDWLSGLLAAEPSRVHLLSTYYDTPDQALKQFGVGLRLRQVDQTWLQTVKCSGEAVNGLHQRKEWEHELQQARFDETRLAETALAPLLDKPEVWSALQPVFSTEFDRQIFPLVLQDGTEVEMAYDVGEVRAGNRRAVIHEIELELKHGDLKTMLQLADLLKASLPLQYSDISKSGQGYGLAQLSEK